MKTDIEIAQEAKMKPIAEIAAQLGIGEQEYELYGRYKAKIDLKLWERLKDKPDGKLILVTAINPTSAGEGKSTTTVGLGQALAKLDKKVVVALREPSLGPCMGVKGGAAGGGYSQVVPMEDINLHFTGDIHAVTTAHNLLAALIDNHLQQGNELKIDPRRITWKRVMDMNDRALRNIVVGLGGKFNGVPREDGFDISVASEIMAILCLAADLTDLKTRLNKIVVAYTYDNQPVTVEQLKAAGAMALLLKDALKPNLVQTLENVPAFIHGGPFANIAHGCNSITATRLGLKLADYLITEAGFGADLGAEKFFNIKCRYGELKPDAVILVASIRALKTHGGVGKNNLNRENLQAVARGFANLEKHLENVARFGVPTVVAINVFPQDTAAELELVESKCRDLGVEFALSEVWAQGGNGGIDLAEKMLKTLAEEKSNFSLLYENELPLVDKITRIAKEVYGAAGVNFAKQAKNSLQELTDLGYGNLPICMAKTQYSLTDDPNLLGRPEGFFIEVKSVRLSAGAGFVVALTGEIMTMPGLPKRPAAESMDIDQKGVITGLF